MAHRGRLGARLRRALQQVREVRGKLAPPTFVAAARAAERGEPEGRSEILAHFWHRGLADVFFEAGEFGASIPHYEEAIRKTTIDGYRKECEQRLGEARRKLAAT